jgi:alkylated DNA repair dioxygenase AlkB
MYDLFNPVPDNLKSMGSAQHPVIFNDTSAITGLSYIPNFLTGEEENQLVKIINKEPWLADIKRRVQHYGYKYDYKARSIDYSMYLGALPNWAKAIGGRLHSEGYIEQDPDQLIVNEYIPGQGIANHIDCEPCFGETIISISLASYCIMDFVHVKSKQKIEVMLEPGSLVIINGEARHKWTHGIAQRKTDVFKGNKFDRKLRISMTFRKVLLK